MTFIVESVFAGIWSMLWHWGLGAGLIIGCAAGAWFLPLWRKDFLYAGALVAVFLVAEAVGIHDEKVHRDAQDALVQHKVDDAVTKTQTQTGQPDPWDDPNN